MARYALGFVQRLGVAVGCLASILLLASTVLVGTIDTAMAASTGCAAIESATRGGATIHFDERDPDLGDLVLNSLTFHAGEKIRYQVVSASSSNTDPMLGGYFVISKSYSHTYLDLYATAENEMNADAVFEVPETRADYYISAGAGEYQYDMTVTVTLSCLPAENQPTITEISPSTGNRPGGAPVTITGTNLAGTTEVTIGGNPASEVSVNEAGTQIVAITPAGSGKADVVVTTSAGNAMLPAAFTYSEPTIELGPKRRGLPTGTLDTPYPGATITASGGEAPYKFTLWSWHTLPDGLSLDPDTGRISGTPTEVTSKGFYIAATDANGSTAMEYFTMQVGRYPAPVITRAPVSLTVARGGTALFSVEAEGAYQYHWEVKPKGWDIWADHEDHSLSADPTLPIPNASYLEDGMKVRVTVVNADYSQHVTSAPVTLTVTRRLPVTITFSPEDGALADAMAGEAYHLPIVATGGEGDMTYMLESGAMPDGLNLGWATGELTGLLAADSQGRYDFAIRATDGKGRSGTANYTLQVLERSISVSDKSRDVAAGSQPTNVLLTEGATGGPFSDAQIAFVDPPAAGDARIVRGEFAAIDAADATGWYLKFVPARGFSGKARVGFTLTSALGTSNQGIVTYTIGLDSAAVVADTHAAVQSMVRTRLNLVASGLHVPGLVERRLMGRTGPMAAQLTPAGDGITLGFATSLIQLGAASEAAEGVAGGAADAPFNVWVDGTFMLHNSKRNGERWGNFGLASVGADYLISDTALVGLSLHFDHITDPGQDSERVRGDGWLAGPYASFELGQGVFWDISLLYGGSDNRIEMPFWSGGFETRRRIFDSEISGRWELDEVTALTPRLRATYLDEEVADYQIENDQGDSLAIEGFSTRQLRVSAGLDIARRFALDTGAVLTPRLALDGGLAGLDGDGAFGSLSAGASLVVPQSVSIDGTVRMTLGTERTVGASVGISGAF